jgi:hypothetical protein
MSIMIRIVGGPFHGSRIQAPGRSSLGLKVRLKSGDTKGPYLITHREGYPGSLEAVYEETSE